jgi:hypothetical protein
LVNATLGEVHGLQLGIVNIARRSSGSIGLVDILYGGRTDVVLWGTETGHILTGVEHGDGSLYNVYGVGLRVGPDGTALAVALGLGVRALQRERFELATDLVVTYLPTNAGEGGSWLQASLRVPLRLQVHERFGVFVAPTWSVWLADDASVSSQAPWPERVLREGPGPRVTAWPGVSLGARVALGRARSK